MYRYDAWNRLVGVWYADAGGTGDAGQRVAAYAYDALFRRVSKTVSNQGLGCVHGSDAGGMAGIQAGDRAEHYFSCCGTGFQPVDIEERDGADRTLAQTVFGTQYIDEPVCRDRNTDPVAGGSADNDCLDAGGSQRYFYHQDANYRVTLLTGEAGGVVERYDYSAYGEPAIFGGAVAGGLGESGAALTVSSVGNPLMHQGLYRDGESGSYQNRYRQYGSDVGRWMQVDPLGYADSVNLHEYANSEPSDWVDPLGLQLGFVDPITLPPTTGIAPRVFRSPWARSTGRVTAANVGVGVVFGAGALAIGQAARHSQEISDLHNLTNTLENLEAIRRHHAQLAALVNGWQSALHAAGMHRFVEKNIACMFFGPNSPYYCNIRKCYEYVQCRCKLIAAAVWNLNNTLISSTPPRDRKANDMRCKIKDLCKMWDDHDCSAWAPRPSVCP